MLTEEKEKTIREYFKMSNAECALVVYNYHQKMQKECGAATRGHLVLGTHSVYTTAADFGMSIGRVSQLLAIGRVICEDKGFISKRKEIWRLGLTVRLTNCLKRAGVVYLEDVGKFKVRDLMKIRDFGKKCLEELVVVLKTAGIELKDYANYKELDRMRIELQELREKISEMRKPFRKEDDSDR